MGDWSWPLNTQQWNQSTVPPATDAPAPTTTTTPPVSMVVPGLIAAVLILTFFVLIVTGSILAVAVLWVLMGIFTFILYTYGFINASMLTATKTASAPVAQAAKTTLNVVGSEVFHVSDNKFTYDDAAAVCAAYDSELATLEQILDAYNHGAEWCGYGWSAGGMALYLSLIHI